MKTIHSWKMESKTNPHSHGQAGVKVRRWDGSSSQKQACLGNTMEDSLQAYKTCCAGRERGADEADHIKQETESCNQSVSIDFGYATKDDARGEGDGNVGGADEGDQRR